MKKSISFVFIAILLCMGMFATQLSAQGNLTAKDFSTKAAYHDYLAKERGYKSLSKTTGPLERKRSILNVGNVEARIRNSATFGYDRDGKCYEYPSGSGITYRWTMAPLVGFILDGTKVLASGTYGAARGHEDEFEPLAGLDGGWSDTPINNYGIAASDRPDTWPAAWPVGASMPGGFMPPVGIDGFPGILDGEVVANRELYYACIDDGNNVLPGYIRVDCWAIQYEDFINEDFIIFKLIVTNVSDRTLSDVYIGMHDDPDTPEQGTAEWTDDYAVFIPVGTDVDGYEASDDSLLWNFSYLWDGDDRVEGLIPSKVPWVGLKVLETPEDPDNPGFPKGLTTLDVFEYSMAPQTEITEYDQLASGILAPQNVTPHPDDWTQTPNSYGPDITYVFGSGPFTLEPGGQLNFALASIHGVNKKDLFNNAMLCQRLYNKQYQASEPPPEPHLKAKVGDGTVTLFWDAYPTEQAVYLKDDGTIDHVGDKLTGNNAFEGYKIFKSRDRGVTWGDAMIGIDGSLQGEIPLAQYDLINGIKYESETRPFFYLGEDTGLKHTFVDNNVDNGYEYWYAVVAYDHDDGPIPPIGNAIKNDASMPNDNTIAVIPQGKVAGYRSGTADSSAQHPSGTSDVQIPIEIVNPELLTGATYEVTFVDTSAEKTFTVTNLTTLESPKAGVQSVENWALYDEDIDNAPIFDGIKLTVADISIGINSVTGSSANYGTDYELTPAGYYYFLDEFNHDYEIEFTSETYTIYSFWNLVGYSEPDDVCNFKVTDLTTGQQVTAIWRDGGGYNLAFDYGERILINPTPYGTAPAGYDGYQFWLDVYTDPAVGDIITVISNKPLSSNDVYRFSTTAETYAQISEDDLEQITTVPNPFVVSSPFETGAYSLKKEVQFHYLPPTCTIRIYNIAGDLIRTLEHTNGTAVEPWDLQSYNQQEVAFGVYFYHIDAPGIGEHIGKMAIIK